MYKINRAIANAVERLTKMKIRVQHETLYLRERPLIQNLLVSQKNKSFINLYFIFIVVIVCTFYMFLYTYIDFAVI